jgi:hypothetical protein
VRVYLNVRNLIVCNRHRAHDPRQVKHRT